MRKFTIREGRFKNTNPLRVTDLTAVQTSDQYTAYLLCHACEQRFSAQGEAWVLRHCWRGTAFPLCSILAAEKASLITPAGKAYDVGAIASINVSALAYFAASIFWRAAVHNWSGRSVKPPIDLGPYREQLRQYLNGSADFPKHCILVVVLPTRHSDFVTHIQNPYPKRYRGTYLYILRFLGIGFFLHVGRQISPNLREADLVRGPGNPIIVTPRFEDMFRHDLFAMLGKRTRVLAKLDEIEKP